jgi:thiol-disulfide isomerase/thioredoxin
MASRIVTAGFKAAAGDLLWGLAAFIAVRIVLTLTGRHQDIRIFAIAVAFAFSGATFYRGKKPRGLVATVFLVGLGGLLPGLILNRLGVSLTAIPFLVTFVTAGVLASGIGVLLRWLVENRKHSIAVVTAGASLFCLLVAAFRVLPEWIDSRSYMAVHRHVDPFEIRTFAGKHITSEDLKGRVVVLSFWATWCLPCHAELPKIQTLADRYIKNPSVLIMAVDSGTEGDNATKAAAFLEKQQLAIAAAIDSADGDYPGPAAKSLGVPNLPAVYVLDKSGDLRVTHLGYDSSEDLVESLSRHIDSLL